MQKLVKPLPVRFQFSNGLFGAVSFCHERAVSGSFPDDLVLEILRPPPRFVESFLDPCDMFPDCGFGVLLHAAVESGVDFQAVAVDVDVVLLRHRLEGLADILREVGRLAVVRDRRIVQFQGACPGFFHLFLRNEASLFHQADNQVSPASGIFRIPRWIIGAGAFQDADERRAFRQCELACRFVEVCPCRGFDAVCSRTEVNRVEVERQYLVLRVGLFKLDGGEKFADLAVDGAFLCQEEVLCELLRDGAGPVPALAALEEILGHDKDKPADVEAPVIVESEVLGGYQRFRNMVRDRVQMNVSPVFKEVFVQKLAVRGIDQRGELGIGIFKFLDARKGPHQAENIDEDHCEENQRPGEQRLCGDPYALFFPVADVVFLAVPVHSVILSIKVTIVLFILS